MKKPTFLVKYDFSNAFGTLNHKTFLKTFEKLNVHASVLDYVKSYLHNQKIAQTVVRDEYGSYISKKNCNVKRNSTRAIGMYVFVYSSFA